MRSLRERVEIGKCPGTVTMGTPPLENIRGQKKRKDERMWYSGSKGRKCFKEERVLNNLFKYQ